MTEPLTPDEALTAHAMGRAVACAVTTDAHLYRVAGNGQGEPASCTALRLTPTGPVPVDVRSAAVAVAGPAWQAAVGDYGLSIRDRMKFGASALSSLADDQAWSGFEAAELSRCARMHALLARYMSRSAAFVDLLRRVSHCLAAGGQAHVVASEVRRELQPVQVVAARMVGPQLCRHLAIVDHNVGLIDALELEPDVSRWCILTIGGEVVAA